MENSYLAWQSPAAFHKGRNAPQKQPALARVTAALEEGSSSPHHGRHEEEKYEESNVFATVATPAKPKSNTSTVNSNSSSKHSSNCSNSDTFIWRTRSLDDDGTAGRRRFIHNQQEEQNEHDDRDGSLHHLSTNQRSVTYSAKKRAPVGERRHIQQQQKPLHCSFDGSLLAVNDSHINSNSDNSGSNPDNENNSNATSIFRTSKRRASDSGAALFNNNNNDASILSTPHSSGRKHLRQPIARTPLGAKTPAGLDAASGNSPFYLFDTADEDDEFICPGTVRKLARHNSNESAKSKGTPARLLGSNTPGWKTNNNCPASVWKAPRTQGISKFPLTPTAPNSTATTQPPTTQQGPLPGSSHYKNLQHHQHNSMIKNQHNNNSPSGTPFRFTSFPASLPRVHPPLRDTAAAEKGEGPTVPDSIRKRMYFGFPPSSSQHQHHLHGATTGAGAPSSTHHQHSNNHSREEDGTQNTSISSLSTHGEEDPRMPPVHTRLFLDEEQYAYSDDEDEDDDNGNNADVANAAAVGRTRLNFNLLLSPNNNRPSKNNDATSGPAGTKELKQEGHDQDSMQQTDNDEGHSDDVMENESNSLHSFGQNQPDESPFKDLQDAADKEVCKMNDMKEDDTFPTELSRPYEQRHVQSFPSTMSSHTPLRNLSGCDDLATTSIDDDDGLMESGNLEEDPTSDGTSNHHHHHRGPLTPREVQMHFQFDSAHECSPIPGIPEEEEFRVRPCPSSFRMGKTASRLPPKPHPPTDANPTQSSKLTLGKPAKDTQHRHHSQQDDVRSSVSGGSASSSASAKQRRLRPMPDMSAFEMESGSKTDGHYTDMSGDTMSASSPKTLQCPPTPVRTPAWAHSDNKSSAGRLGGEGGKAGAPVFHRSNSLTMTRVLATCSDAPFAPDAGAFVKVDTEDTAMEDHDMDLGPDDAKIQDSSREESIAEPQHPEAPPRIRRSVGELRSIISFATDFVSLGTLGSGAFADVFKVRSKLDNKLYAVKRNRRHFRGKRDRDIALAEVRAMQRLQQLASPQQGQQHTNNHLQYLLFFYRAWQEDGHFFCQTELCCRDTCRELMDSLSVEWHVAKNRYPSLLRNLPAPEGVVAGSSLDVAGRHLPDTSVWKICHDICSGLSHMHTRGLCHQDIKPSNIFFVAHPQLGSLCKIGDFGMSGDIGSCGDGEEGDQKYMAPELLSSEVKHASSDMFSLGLTLYEISAAIGFELPKQGPRWHELRSGSHCPEVPPFRDSTLRDLIQHMISPGQDERPSADSILAQEKVSRAGTICDIFLRDYINDIESYDQKEEERQAAAVCSADDKTPRHSGAAACRARVCSPTLGHFTSSAPAMFTPEAQ